MSIFLGYLRTNIKVLSCLGFFKLSTCLLSLQTKWKGLSIKHTKMESVVWTTKKIPQSKVNAYLEVYFIGFIILKFRRS